MKYRVKLERVTTATATVEVEVDVSDCEDEQEKLDRVYDHAIEQAQKQVDGEDNELETIDWSSLVSDEVSMEGDAPEEVS